MSDITDLCSAFAGGFSQEGSNCVVGIYSTTGNKTQLFEVEARALAATEDPETLLNRLCAWSNEKAKDTVVRVYQLCGGIDGKKMAASNR